MGKKELVDFVNSKNKSKSGINNENRIKLWLEACEKLFKKIEFWLKDLIDKGDITKTYEQWPTHTLGANFQTITMKLNISDSKVEIEPVSHEIMGAYGRVDIKGPFGKSMLVLVESDQADENFDIESNGKKFIWELVIRTPKFKTMSLDEDIFSDILMDIIGDE